VTVDAVDRQGPTVRILAFGPPDGVAFTHTYDRDFDRKSLALKWRVEDLTNFQNIVEREDPSLIG
jgi:hypothetical protein